MEQLAILISGKCLVPIPFSFCTTVRVELWACDSRKLEFFEVSLLNHQDSRYLLFSFLTQDEMQSVLGTNCREAEKAVMIYFPVVRIIINY